MRFRIWLLTLSPCSLLSDYGPPKGVHVGGFRIRIEGQASEIHSNGVPGTLETFLQRKALINALAKLQETPLGGWRFQRLVLAQFYRLKELFKC